MSDPVKVFRVETRSTVLRPEEREVLAQPGHVRQCQIFVTAQSGAEALRLLDGAGHRASRSHLLEGIGDGADVIRNSGLFDVGGRVYVTTSSEHVGAAILRVGTPLGPMVVGRWEEDPDAPLRRVVRRVDPQVAKAEPPAIVTGARDDESPTAYAIRVVKEQGAREALAALRERCAEKVPVLKQMAADHDSMTEEIRLKGKAEGLKQAISYLDEYVRTEGLS